MLPGMQQVTMLIQEITKFQILEWTLISKTLLPILISNKAFTEDGVLMASQSQKLLKLFKMEKAQSYQPKLLKRKTQNSKPPLPMLMQRLKISQLAKTSLRQMKSLSHLHQLAPVILKMQFKLHL
jgi:hypothetical protein